MDKKFTFDELHAIVATLRSDHGCPWDRAQTHESMKENTIEEAYEVVQAIDDLSATGKSDNLCEELGDLLLQVLMQSQIAEEYGEFALEDVIDGIATKMIRRHPHVFGNESYENVAEQQKAWDEIKKQEHDQPLTPVSELETVPAAFPALIRSQKVLKKAIKHDMIASDDETIFKSILNSVISLQMCASTPDSTDEFSKKLGDALFAINTLAAKYKVHSEKALMDKTNTFIKEHKNA